MSFAWVYSPGMLLISVSPYSEILMDERHCDTETIRRENRRVAAMSWGGGDENGAPLSAAKSQMMGECVSKSPHDNSQNLIKTFHI